MTADQSEETQSKLEQMHQKLIIIKPFDVDIGSNDQRIIVFDIFIVILCMLFCHCFPSIVL